MVIITWIIIIAWKPLTNSKNCLLSILIQAGFWRMLGRLIWKLLGILMLPNTMNKPLNCSLIESKEYNTIRVVFGIWRSMLNYVTWHINPSRNHYISPRHGLQLETVFLYKSNMNKPLSFSIGQYSWILLIHMHILCVVMNMFIMKILLVPKKCLNKH